MSWLSSLFNKNDPNIAVQIAQESTQAANNAVTFDAKAIIWLDDLAHVVKQSSSLISPAVFSRLRSIDDVMRPIIKSLKDVQLIVDTEVEIQSILTDYIPTPLDLYLNLPLNDRQDGGKADLILLSQYDTLETVVRDLALTLKGDSVSALETHAIFIKDKFGNV